MEFTAPIRDEAAAALRSDTVHAAAELLSFTGEIMKRECADPALLEVYPDKVSPLIVHIHASCATGRAGMWQAAACAPAKRSARCGYS